jgi:D,D-heptose 1,7-bisphosphate phosphatase
MKLKKAVFLDRDGIINKDLGYVYKPADFSFVPGFPELAHRLKKLDYLLIVVTNQSGVARGYFSELDVSVFHQKIQGELLARVGVAIDRFYICPHHPDGIVKEYSFECLCRKPKTGLIDMALKQDTIDMNRSFLIGDKASDIELAINSDIKGIQLSNGQYAVHPNAHEVIVSLEDMAKMTWIDAI